MRDGATDDEMRDLIARVWSRRADRYSEERAAATPSAKTTKIEMYQIGG